MAVVACTPPGVEYLKNVVGILNSSKDDFTRIANNLFSVADDNAKLLGPHLKEIREILQILRDALNGSSESIIDLSSKVSQLIVTYEEIIGMDLYVDDSDSGDPPPPVKVKRR